MATRQYNFLFLYSFKKTMNVVFLDQNKWIDLSWARSNPDKYPENATFLNDLLKLVDEEKIIIPLTDGLIIETHKMRDDQNRADLASVQCRLSRGFVFQSRRFVVDTELRQYLEEQFCGGQKAMLPPYWFLSRQFPDAFAPRAQSQSDIEKSYHAYLEEHPATGLFGYLVGVDADVREQAASKWSHGADGLRNDLEKNREKLSHETTSMQRRALSALLVLDEEKHILRIANELGLNWTTLTEMGEKAVRGLLKRISQLHVERELALKRNAEPSNLTNNDFGDMMSFMRAIPYADCIIGEKAFVNRARQADLGKQYDTVLSSELKDIFSHI